MSVENLTTIDGALDKFHCKPNVLLSVELEGDLSMVRNAEMLSAEHGC